MPGLRPAAVDAAREGGRSCCATGAIVAVKGLGGYHLACDAANEEAVARLRARKHREDKPFALMTADPEQLAEVGPDEAALLHSRERPIVLVRRRAGRAGRAVGRPGSSRGSG